MKVFFFILVYHKLIFRLYINLFYCTEQIIFYLFSPINTYRNLPKQILYHFMIKTAMCSARRWMPLKGSEQPTC